MIVVATDNRLCEPHPVCNVPSIVELRISAPRLNVVPWGRLNLLTLP